MNRSLKPKDSTGCRASFTESVLGVDAHPQLVFEFINHNFLQHLTEVAQQAPGKPWGPPDPCPQVSKAHRLSPSSILLGSTLVPEISKRSFHTLGKPVVKPSAAFALFNPVWARGLPWLESANQALQHTILRTGHRSPLSDHSPH
uniref:Uncharacterized protein n=1 Tax=Lygus hesperus TaxID=30085 RepID=A0A146MDY6_LYGHE